MAFNTAASFVSNTNWQSYSGEETLSNGAQMLGLTVQNFASAAVGMCVAVALIRGIGHLGYSRDKLGSESGQHLIGNFWVDLTRGLVRILLPLSIDFLRPHLGRNHANLRVQPGELRGRGYSARSGG